MAFGDKVKPIDFSKLSKVSSISDHSERIYQAALIYIEAGYYVLPLDLKRGREKLTSQFNGSFICSGCEITKSC